MKRQELMERLGLTKGVFYIMLGRDSVIKTFIKQEVATVDELKQWRIDVLTELYEENVLGNKLIKPFDKEEFDEMLKIVKISREHLVGLIDNDEAMEVILNGSNLPELVLKNMAQSAVVDLYNELDHVKAFNELMGDE